MLSDIIKLKAQRKNNNFWKTWKQKVSLLERGKKKEGLKESQEMRTSNKKKLHSELPKMMQKYQE